MVGRVGWEGGSRVGGVCRMGGNGVGMGRLNGMGVEGAVAWDGEGSAGWGAVGWGHWV